MDKVQKTAFTDYNAPSSEPFRLQETLVYTDFTVKYRKILVDLNSPWILYSSHIK
jgi:hypothetical protein